MLQNLEQVIRDYLPQIIHLSLATSKDNKPWVCEVHFFYDKDLNLYFRSRPNRRHSLEIKDNPFVAGDIVTQHKIDEAPRGIYFEGKAEMLNNVDESHAAYKSFQERFGDDKAIIDEAMTNDGHKFYKITVNKFYIFDSKQSRPSEKYELKWKD